MPTASRVRVLAADSAPPALASGSGSDSELCDAIGDSGDIAADGAATDDAEEEPSPVDLDSILGNQTSSGEVAADKDGEESDDEEDYLEGDEESVVDSSDERENTGVEEGDRRDICKEPARGLAGQKLFITNLSVRFALNWFQHNCRNSDFSKNFSR